MALPTSPPVSPAPGRIQRAGTVASIAMALFVCLACSLAFVVSQIWLPTAALPFGFMIQGCVDVTPAYIEFIVVSPYISSFAPPSSATCIYSPWAPFLPQRPQIIRIPI